MCDHHLCPSIVSFEAAEKLLDDFEDIHEEPAVNRGVIAINRRAAERAQEAYPCSGPVVNEHNCVQCPLAAVIADTYAMAAMREERRPNITFNAPIGSIDLAAFNEDGEAYEIWPCQNCLPFHAEVVLDDDGDVFVREWHAVECAQFIELTSDVRHEQ